MLAHFGDLLAYEYHLENTVLNMAFLLSKKLLSFFFSIIIILKITIVTLPVVECVRPERDSNPWPPP